jgi:type II secretory pathway pseudopilin PulG
MVVLGILAIMAAMAAPLISQWLPRYRANAATREITMAIQRARLKAASTGTHYRVHVYTDASGAENHLGLTTEVFQINPHELGGASAGWRCVDPMSVDLHPSVSINAANEMNIDLETPAPDPAACSKPASTAYTLYFAPDGTVKVNGAASEDHYGINPGGAIQLGLQSSGGEQYYLGILNTTGQVSVH